jgi:hypothetical protein
MSQPLVGITVPCHNGASTVSDATESALSTARLSTAEAARGHQDVA